MLIGLNIHNIKYNHNSEFAIKIENGNFSKKDENKIIQKKMIIKLILIEIQIIKLMI